MQPTASRTDLLLQCSRPFDPTFVYETEEADEPARYGSAYHDIMGTFIKDKPISTIKLPKVKASWGMIQKVAAEWDVTPLADELQAHIYESAPVFFRWLADNVVGDDPIETETSMAYDPEEGTARLVARPTADGHVYELRPGEIGGTADVIIPARRSRRRMLTVVDHKTGANPNTAVSLEAPEKLGQLRTLALGFDDSNDSTNVAQAVIFHANRRGLAKVHFDVIDSDMLHAHRAGLKKALARIGDGTLKPGPECGFCPMKSICPAVEGRMLLEGRAVLGGLHAKGASMLLASNDTKLSRGQQLGSLYDIVTKGEALAAKAREMIRAEMEKTGVAPELPDGRRLVFETHDEERLSKKAFVEAVGKMEAERRFAKWRAEGALVKKPVRRMVPRD